MAISNDQKIDYLFKKVGFGRAKTDTNTNKSAVNEATSSALFVQGTYVWAESNLIPTTIPGSTSGVVNVRPTSAPVETTNDGTASANRTWKTGLIDWIPPEVGATYLIKVYIHTSGDAGNAASAGTQVFPAGSGNDDEWFFDYPSGTLNFIGTNLPNGINFSGKSVYISGAYYTGIKGVAGPGTAATFTSVAASGIITASSFRGDGSQLTGITAGIGTEGSIDTSGIITATSFEGDGSNLSGIITQLGALSTLAGLLTTNFNDGDVIMYNASQGKFIATAQSNLTGTGRTTLVTLDDVSGTPSTNNVLIFNGSDFTFTTPFEIVDRSDGVDDNIVDHGSF